ncbi:hypothetical protein B5E65_00755 [Gemmiger sp. An120]|uniref:helix-turn-helix transcriptional regulator n=1 Tax=Gemmiger sp. An120 TaxID=1965549 RepID=UPI000B3AF478|nr:helix-turn-helix transcriptional regulator [Gemmiger sp. An120]OUQ44318.1 hypothetical protein B5E65_00755 [Gemmiger sp. An120]HIX34663.1 helix-turn-helix domain-containing protein [Candidatus Gemmiger avium]
MQNRIKQLREENHMTQVRLGIELEVSQETISAYEKQKHYPSFAQLLRLATLFHASIDYIMGLSDVRTPTNPAASGDLGKLMALGQRMDEKQLELVLAYAQGMLDCPK